METRCERKFRRKRSVHRCPGPLMIRAAVLGNETRHHSHLQQRRHCCDSPIRGGPGDARGEELLRSEIDGMVLRNKAARSGEDWQDLARQYRLAQEPSELRPRGESAVSLGSWGFQWQPDRRVQAELARSNPKLAGSH